VTRFTLNECLRGSGGDICLSKGEFVNPEIAAALIGGVGAIVAAVIGALARIRSARQKKVDTSNDRIVLPPPAPDPVSPEPAESTPSAGSTRSADADPFDLPEPMPPLNPLPDRYIGLTGQELLVSFIADAEMSRKPEDTFKIIED
jgi:hypothetical protein